MVSASHLLEFLSYVFLEHVGLIYGWSTWWFITVFYRKEKKIFDFYLDGIYHVGVA